jgi:hypothetical protein
LVLAGQPMYLKAVLGGFYLFGESVWVGAKIIFTSRKFIWLVPGYSFALYGHRYLENAIAPALARRYFGNSAWSQIMVGGSNFGELLGALVVFLFSNAVRTPIPWLRLDACLLFIVWYLSSWWVPTGRVTDAWMVAGTFIPISFGWAAGDVSLAAYIQALLQRKEKDSDDVSPLGAVMAFLYCTYIVIYAITSSVIGRYIDRVGNANTNNFSKGLNPVPGWPDGYINIHSAIFNIAGVQFTVIAISMLLATFIPKGSFAFNPKSLYGETLQTDESQEDIVREEDEHEDKGEHRDKDEGVAQGITVDARSV